MSNKATVIAVVNQKGGTGKTTTCENLGIGLANEGKKVLLVDTDPQGSLTIALGNPRPDDLPVTLTDLMAKIMQDQPPLPKEGILSHEEGVDLVPASITLSGLEVSLVNAMSRETILKQYLETVKGSVRLHSAGLHAVSWNAYRQCAGCFRPGAHSRSGQLSVGKRPGTAASDRQQGQEADQSEVEDRRDPSDHGGFPHELCEGNQHPDP